MSAFVRSQVSGIYRALFMDLAFLLIASLVLLVKDPADEIKAKVESYDVSPTTVAKIRETAAVEGEVLFVEMDSSGRLFTLDKGSASPTDLVGLRARVLKMPPGKERVVVLVVDPKTQYDEYQQLRSYLNEMVREHHLTALHETRAQGE